MSIKNIHGKVYLENPTNNQNFTRPDDKQMKIVGWAVSGDANASLQILIDEKVVESSITRISRGDVDSIVSPSYGGVAMTPKAGFNSIIDISTLNVGNHTLKVREISRYGDIICESKVQIQIVNKKYLGEMCIDNPIYNTSYNVGDNITVTGWAVAEDEKAIVEVYIDNNLKATASRHYREDVVYYMNKYGNKTVNAGFDTVISSAGLSNGTHTLTVYEKSRYGEIIGGVEVKIVINVPSTNLPNNSSNVLTSGSKGIDVSQHQGNINWSSVANSGIKFTMIRIGYRGYATGGLAEDSKFKDNFQNASANGLKVGVYFYSTAINTTEAKKDAEYVMSLLNKYGYQNKVTMPIAIDLEVNSSNVRDANVSKTVRTDIANTFCSTIASYGYTPMVYASKSFLNSNMNASQVNYDIWVAQYNSKCTYTGNYTMWQYSSTGKVSGISGNVDCNICYKNY